MKKKIIICPTIVALLLFAGCSEEFKEPSELNIDGTLTAKTQGESISEDFNVKEDYGLTEKSEEKPVEKPEETPAEKAEEKPAEKPTETEIVSTNKEEQERILSEFVSSLFAINDVLVAASKGAGNPLAQIGGFSEELEIIKSMSESIIPNVEEMVDKLDEKADSEVFLNNSTKIAEYHKSFETKLSDIKTAKQNTDISAVKKYLSEMIEIIDEYQAFLNDFEEELSK